MLSRSDLNFTVLGVYSSIVRRSKGNQNKSEHLKAEHSKDTDGSDDVGDDEGWDGIIRRAVIGVPANCSEKKKEATRRAARTAGFEEVRSEKCSLALGNTSAPCIVCLQ